MIDPEIQAYVKQEIQRQNSVGRFQLTPIQRHIHNNIDSPYTFQPILTYVGLVGYDGTAILLPKGWKITKDAAFAGVYTVTHNLGTLLYGCVASASQSTNIYAVPVISAFQNEVDFTWGNVATDLSADTSFFFSLTVINNKSQTLPSYVGTYAP